MQFRIAVNRVGAGWEMNVLNPDTGQAMLDPRTVQPILVAPRVLGAQGVGAEAFPLPPTASAASLPLGWTPDNLDTKYSAVMNQAAAPGDVTAFGRYLFNTLLGPELWQAINEIAGKAGMELALSWPATDAALNRLPWEIMHSGAMGVVGSWEGFLAGVSEVTITRRVLGSTVKVTEIPSPPRVLFVVGSRLEDSTIRAGAEYIGLLRYLRINGCQLHSRILLKATPDTLQAAIKAYRPNVVHFICHGVITGNREPALQFQLREDDDKATTELMAGALIENLRTDQNLPLPSIVVLNACSTGTSEEMQIGRPLAATLVADIPIVVGMTGQIADQACRLFTKGFYGALLAGGDIAYAAARGRRAAIAHGGYDPSSTVDWALPALFLSEKMGEACVDIRAKAGGQERLVAAEMFLTGYSAPAFCDRWEIFRQYDQLVSGNDVQFIGISKPTPDKTNLAGKPPPQLGRSRLLRELAAQAFRDGHVPILVSKAQRWLNRLDDEGPWPDSLGEFLKLVCTATENTVAIFQRLPDHETLVASCTNLKALKKKPVGKSGDEFIRLQAEALRRDLLSLRDAVCTQRPQEERQGIKLILLMDDVHRMTFAGDLFYLLGFCGLRESNARKFIRCVFTYSTEPIFGQEVAVKEINTFAASPDVVTVPLAVLHDSIRFDKPQERKEEFERASLVYKHFLLHWQLEGKPRPLTLALPDADPYVVRMIAGLAGRVEGYPSLLTDARVQEKVLTYLEMSTLRDADDEDALRDLVNLPRR